MNDEIYFLFDEESEKRIRELNYILEATKNPYLEKRVNFLKMFAYALAKASIIEKKPIKEERKIIIPKIKKIKEVHRPIIPYNEKTLVIDNITNQILASAIITNKYYIKEPSINKKDVAVIEKVISLRPENMAEGWKLISEYGRRFNIPIERFTNIKYYIVNYLYSMGKIEGLLHDQDISEIICEKENEAIKVKYRDRVIETNILFYSKGELDKFIYYLAGKFNKRIDERNNKFSHEYKGFRFECKIGFKKDENSKFIIKKF